MNRQSTGKTATPTTETESLKRLRAMTRFAGPEDKIYSSGLTMTSVPVSGYINGKAPMKTGKELQNAILEAALKVSSQEELTRMSEPSRLTFLTLIKRRLEAPLPPTVDELQGIKELTLEWLSHPALGALSKPLPTSPTTSSQTSPSPQTTEPQSGGPSDDQS